MTAAPWSAAWVWPAAGAGVALVGVLLLAWALLWDRARGRLRCPKCWYDMRGAIERGSLVCPECGRDAKREKRLRKTRRRWRWAVAAVILITAGAATGVYPRLPEQTRLRFAPNTLLIAQYPEIKSDNDPLTLEIDRRFRIRERAFADDRPGMGLWGWQKRMLTSRCREALRSGAPFPVSNRALMFLHMLGPDGAAAAPELIALIKPGNEHVVAKAAQCLVRMGEPGRAAAPAIVAYLQAAGEEPYGKKEAIRAAAVFLPDTAACLPRLVEIAGTPGQPWKVLDCRVEAVRAIGAFGPDARELVPMLLALLDNDQASLRIAAMEALGRIAPAAPEVADAAGRLIRDPEAGLRFAAAGAVRRDPGVLAGIVSSLASELASEEADERIAAARGLVTLDADAAGAQQALIGALADTEPLVRAMAVRALGAGAGASPAARAAIERRRSDPDHLVRNEAEAAARRHGSGIVHR